VSWGRRSRQIGGIEVVVVVDTVVVVVDVVDVVGGGGTDVVVVVVGGTEVVVDVEVVVDEVGGTVPAGTSRTSGVDTRIRLPFTSVPVKKAW
jgi:hypothetical protein